MRGVRGEGAGIPCRDCAFGYKVETRLVENTCRLLARRHQTPRLADQLQHRVAFLVSLEGASPPNPLCGRQVEQRVGLFSDEFAPRQPLDPVLWDRVDAVKSAGELAVDRACGVSVVTQVHRTQRSFTK